MVPVSLPWPCCTRDPEISGFSRLKEGQQRNVFHMGACPDGIVLIFKILLCPPFRSFSVGRPVLFLVGVGAFLDPGAPVEMKVFGIFMGLLLDDVPGIGGCQRSGSREKARFGGQEMMS